MIDGKKEEITGFNVEKPGLFLGRGESKKQGKVKEIYSPDDIILNLDEDCEIPVPPDISSNEVPYPRGNIPWDAIVHDHRVQYIAQYKDSITGHPKYTRVSRKGTFAARGDVVKFDKARLLYWNIDAIRKKKWQTSFIRKIKRTSISNSSMVNR